MFFFSLCRVCQVCVSNTQASAAFSEMHILTGCRWYVWLSYCFQSDCCFSLCALWLRPPWKWKWYLLTFATDGLLLWWPLNMYVISPFVDVVVQMVYPWVTKLRFCRPKKVVIADVDIICLLSKCWVLSSGFQFVQAWDLLRLGQSLTYNLSCSMWSESRTSWVKGEESVYLGADPHQ